MDADEITEAQQRFVEKFDLGIAANEVEAALFTDMYSVYTYDNLYELSYMDRETWVNFVLDKYELQGVKGAKEYVGIKYDEYTHEESNYIYNGKDAFYSIHQAWVDRGDLTASQLEEVYLHFCALEYDQEYTQALMNHFGCTAEQVYLEHSDVLTELKGLTGNWSDIANDIKSIASRNGIDSNLAAKVYCIMSDKFDAESEYSTQYYLNSYFSFS